MEGPSCTGCDLLIDEGSVIAFGDSLFHLKCFVCAKCGDPVDCDSNLLLLTNGRPVCENCSYCCNACKQVIRDEAIMTGDEAYHADCFQCVSCKKKIDDLVFTQTSKGIHCTPCHEKRRAEKQRRREEREKRNIQKQNKELPSIPVENGPVPRRYPASSAQNDYGIQPRRNHPLDRTGSSTSFDPPTPSRSRSNSVEIPKPRSSSSESNRLLPQPTTSRSEMIRTPNSPPLSIGSSSPANSHSSASNRINSLDQSLHSNSLPSLNLSFFDNESTDLLNLTKNLGANIAKDIYAEKKVEQVPEIVKTTENITRASQYLESSLFDQDDEFEDFPPPPQHASDVETQLRAELELSNSKLGALQLNFNKIKEASRKALEEFSRAKEEFKKEVQLRQQQEYTIVQLQHQLYISYQSNKLSRSELSSVTREEIERVARMRVELDKTCNDLKGYRNLLAKDIESLASQAGLESSSQHHIDDYHKVILTEIRSLKTDREHIKTETTHLEKMRDDVLHEMVMLNTKNAELTEMNNDLSRRVTEREREAAAVMAGTSFLHTSPSPSLSSELQSPILMQRKSSEASVVRKVAARDSFNGNTQQPKMFKLKKKGAMFSKFSNKNTKEAAIYGTPNASTLSLSGETKRSKQSQEMQHGSHTFQPTSFLRPTKCDACGEKMWGLSELRCSGCFYATHARCLQHVPQLCYGTGNTSSSFDLSESQIDLSRSLFGTDLGARAHSEDRAIPLVIEQCIMAVEKRGMDYEGIYRKSGGAAQMRLIQNAFNGDEQIDLESDEPINDICAITSILKQYFRELPDPLLTYMLYPKFIEAVSINNGKEKADRFYELLSQLPKVNYETLSLLIHHLDSVQQRHSENLMTTKNLAMVFGPTLMRDAEASRDLLDMSYKNAVIEYLIVHVDELFTI
ncbi:RhoGAP-domain-containing protein [Backusella circina FSU 941]|nr:RhoGAP-domain-containing protein [Backusella circina FSU 941]